MSANYETLAAWSAWVPLREARPVAPTTPGVYVIGLAGSPVYVGYAAERSGRGLAGRLGVYLSGKAAVSGFGEAAFDRALADPSWVSERVRAAEASRQPERAKAWAAAAVERLPFEARWASTTDGSAAKELEKAVIAVLRPGLWNRR